MNFNDTEINLIAPEAFREEISMSVKTPMMLDLDTVQFRAKIRAMAIDVPGMEFSGYRSMTNFFLDALTSTE